MTIIVMLILVGVTVNVTLNGGLFANAKKAAFYEEMSAIEENKEIEKVITFIKNKEEGSQFLDRQVTVEELRKFKETLKAEIIYARNSLGKGEKIKTSKIWKDNTYQCQTIYESDEYAEGIAEDIFYISKASSGKEQTYIYDRVSDTCFKIPQTKIGKEIVHSLPYARLMLDGEYTEGTGVVEDESGIMQSSDGIVCYEPNLYNFSYKTEIVYYSSDFKREYTMPIKQFIEEGKPATKVVEGETYTFADYKENESQKNAVWANIKTTSNGLESYWVWIPRYAYKLNTSEQKSEIIFVDINNKPMNKKDGEELPEGYKVHEAFSQENELKGIWFAKYNPSPVETAIIDNTEPEVPDLTKFNKDNTKLIYYTKDTNKYIEVDYTENPQKEIEQNGTQYYFYDYENKIWANIKTTANGLESWWVWIPRYAYRIGESGTTKVILVDQNNKPIDKETYGESLPIGYKLHEAFSQENELKGIWMAKYNPSPVETAKVDLTELGTPDLSNFDSSNTKLIYYAENANSYIEVDYTETPEREIERDGKKYYFYNYENKMWANIKTTANGLESWWVWIPRYAYKISESGTIKIILVDENDKPLDKDKFGDNLPDGYKIHEAFQQESEIKNLKGIWFAKYNPSSKTN